MEPAVLILLIFAFVVVLLIAVAFSFDVGYRCGSRNAYTNVGANFPGGLNLEQVGWIIQQRGR